MHDQATDLLLPEDADIAAVADAIRAHVHCDEGRSGRSVTRFLDSFDWSLYRVGATLEDRLDERGRVLIWRALDQVGADAVQPIDADVGLVDSVPVGPVRERLAPLLGVRRLLPMVEVRTGSLMLRVLNADDKTVARILVEQHWLAGAPASTDVPLLARLRLLPVRGYQQELRETAERLRRHFELELAQIPLFERALAAAGREPGSYSSKLAYHLDPGQRADAATKEILLGLLETIAVNVDGAKSNLDSEFLHDLRVATRRTRSALSQIKGVLPPDIVDDFKGRFAWLQQVTGPVRDLDVYLLDYPRLRDSLPPRLGNDLEPLRDWLSAHYAEEQDQLAAALESSQFLGLLEDWRRFLVSPVLPETAPANAARPIKVVADRRIWRMFRRVRSEGRAITAESPPPELHELRKSCKKLRYLMEFFQSLYPENEVRGLIKQTKLLLDNLGAYQDSSVQAEHLRETAERMHAEGAADTGALLAMGALIKRMLDTQQQARQAFGRTFAEFDDGTNGALFRKLFRVPEAATLERAPGDSE